MKLNVFQGVEHAVMRNRQGSYKLKTVGHVFKVTGREAQLVDVLCERLGVGAPEVMSRVLAEAVGDVEVAA